MAHDYRFISWTPFKKRFDIWLSVGVVLYLITFFAVSILSQKQGESFTPIQIIIRATGTLGFLMLCLVLSIGPLARLTQRMRPFLYNRRHLGVATFLIALIHSALTVLWYHGFSSLNPFISVFVSNPLYSSIAGFPFEVLGFTALLILYLMAATSHDFWNTNLGPGLWKALHMGGYAAFALLVLHIALGAIQFERDPLFACLLYVAAGGVTFLHVLTGLMGLRPAARLQGDGWIKVAAVKKMAETKAKIVYPPEGEAIAIFRYQNKLYGVSHICRHQAGPLGEGRIVDGVITCPWHGFQYRMEDGRSPAPFSETIATYATEIRGAHVYVNPSPNAPGTKQAPSIIDAATGQAPLRGSSAC